MRAKHVLTTLACFSVMKLGSLLRAKHVLTTLACFSVMTLGSLHAS